MPEQGTIGAFLLVNQLVVSYPRKTLATHPNKPQVLEQNTRLEFSKLPVFV